MQLADSDAGLYAIGVLSQLDLDAEVSYPDVHPVQVQGPLSAKTLEKLVGPAIYDIKYYWCERFTIGDIPVVISRTGWSAVPGFEVNLLDGTRGDALWQAIMDAGEEFAIRPIAPNEARRVEAGIFNWGSDISLGDTPFHVMGLERLVEDQPQDYIGKQALERVRREGVDRRLVGIEFDRDRADRGHHAALAGPRRRQADRARHRRRLVAGPAEEHRLRVGADGAVRARERHRCRVRDRHRCTGAPPPSHSSIRARSGPRRRCRARPASRPR